MPTPDLAPTAPPARRACLGWLVTGSIYLGVMVLSALLIEPWLPYPEIPGAGEKIRYLALHGNENNALFIGSSRVNFQILPSLFDSAVAAPGRPMKSFNGGLLGMRPPEQGCFLDDVLRQPHGRLQWVFVELTSLEARTPPSRRGSARYLQWHDAPRMALLAIWLRAEWASLRGRAGWMDKGEPLAVWLSHAGYFCQRTLNLGRGDFVGDTWIVAPSKRAKLRTKFRSLGEKMDGWLPYDGAREIMNEQERAEYLASYEARLAQPAVHFHDPASDAAIEAMRRAVIKAGATPIFFVPPMTTERHYVPSPDLARNMIIWNFSDPHRYPQLFLPEHRLDPVHLNTAGGKEFTRALAERFAELPR